MNRSRNRSLAFIVATGLVTVSTLLTGIYSIIDYNVEKRSMQERLQALARLQIHEIRVALEEPVWNIDRPQIEKVIEAMALPQSVYGLRVNAAGQTFGRQRDAQWKLAPWTGRNVPRGLLVYDGDITFSGNRIGAATLYVSTKYIDEDLRALRMRLIGTVLLIDVILVLAVYLLVARLVLNPVRSLERYAVAVAGGGQTEAPAPAAAELANLRASIEAMVHQLEARHVELQEEMARRAESEQRYVSIFESVNDAIVVRDLVTGAVVDVNQRACDMFGMTREEFFAVGIGELSSEENGFEAAAAAAMITDPQNVDTLHEWQVRDGAGRLFWVEVNMRHAELGGARRAILALRDITRRRKMEEALRLNERLSAIGTLVAGVAHEVRNPLFGISATLDAFEAEFPADGAKAEYLEMLRRDVARLTRLMNDLLEYGRPWQITRRRQPLGPVIAEAMRVCASAAEKKHVRIEPSVAGDLIPITIDADRMLQVLKNVLENAIEFSHEGGRVTVDARNADHAVTLSIRDSGPGFRAEDLATSSSPSSQDAAAAAASAWPSSKKS